MRFSALFCLSAVIYFYLFIGVVLADGCYSTNVSIIRPSGSIGPFSSSLAQALDRNSMGTLGAAVRTPGDRQNDWHGDPDLDPCKCDA